MANAKWNRTAQKSKPRPPDIAVTKQPKSIQEDHIFNYARSIQALRNKQYTKKKKITQLDDRCSADNLIASAVSVTSK